MRRFVGIGFGVMALCFATWAGAAPEEEQKSQDAPKPPPELTGVSGRLILPKDAATSAGEGVAYFVFQRRLLEIPHENPMDKVKAMSEAAVAVDKDGSFSLQMAPGNYALVYEPGAEASEEALKPGAESFSVAKKLSPEQQKARIAAIQDNVKNGMAIKEGKLGDAYVIENRIVRPPVIEFGEMVLGADHSVTVLAAGESGGAVDFPLALRLRGKNGDVYEPHPPSTTDPGKFVFSDVDPQEYDVFAIGQRPKPGEGDELTTPSVQKGAFVFEGEPKEVKVTVAPGTAEGTPPEPPKPAAKSNR